MPLKLEAMEEPAINLTPMIDVVLNLMIFFMVSTQFTRHENHYEINLPFVSDARPLTPLPDEIVINVDRNGGIYLGAELRTPEQTEAALTEAKSRYADQAVIIRGDSDVRYQGVMSVLELCKRSGISNIQLANQAGDPARP